MVAAPPRYVRDMPIPAPPGWYLCSQAKGSDFSFEREVLAFGADGDTVLVVGEPGPEWKDMSEMSDSAWLSFGTTKHPVNVIAAPAGLVGKTDDGERMPIEFLGQADGIWHGYVFRPGWGEAMGLFEIALDEGGSEPVIDVIIT